MKIKIIATALFLLSTVPWFVLPFQWALPCAAVTYLYCGLLMNLITHFEERIFRLFVLWYPAMILDKSEWVTK